MLEVGHVLHGGDADGALPSSVDVVQLLLGYSVCRLQGKVREHFTVEASQI